MFSNASTLAWTWSLTGLWLIGTTNAAKRVSFQSYAVDLTVAVLHHCIGEYYISPVSNRSNGAHEGLWQAHYSTSLPHSTPTHPNISAHYPIDLLAFVTKSCSCRFPILDQGKVESALIGADIGGVLQGKPAVTGLMCSCHCVVTWCNMKWYWTTLVWH